MKVPTEKYQQLPLWLTIWWWIAFVAAAPLFFRLLWERTLLTWRHGRRMVGFSLVHQEQGLLFVGLLGYALIIAWTLAAVISFAVRRKRPSIGAVICLSVAALGILMEFVPYDFWAHLGGID